MIVYTLVVSICSRDIMDSALSKMHNYGNHEPHKPSNGRWYTILFPATKFTTGTTTEQKIQGKRNLDS